MKRRRNRYKEMERRMSAFLLGDALVFLLFLIAAGNGIIWLKVITAIIAITASVLCLGFLYLSQELLKPRSLWMSTAAAAIVICLLFSLLLKFPSPNIYKDTTKAESTSQTDPT